MYFADWYWWHSYWGRPYWGPPVVSDCSGGPYVVTGYWEPGYAQCDEYPSYDLVIPVYGGAFHPRKHQPAKRVVEDDGHARREAWEAIERARGEDAARRLATKQPRPAPPVASTTAMPATIPELRAAATQEPDVGKRNAMLALLLILDEV